MVAPQLSVTVLLLHDDPFEVLMVRRPSRGSFASALVFPGGVVEPTDDSVEGAARREVLEETGIDISDVSLSAVARWITPPDRARRYDTHFLLGQLPGAPEPVHDPGELEFARWFAPNRVIELAQAGEELLVFPTLAHLSLVAAAGTATAAVEFASSREAVLVEPLATFHEDGSRTVSISPELGYPIRELRSRAGSPAPGYS